MSAPRNVAAEAVARLRELAEDAVRTATPQFDAAHPDAELIGLCEQMLHNKRQTDIRRSARRQRPRLVGEWEDDPFVEIQHWKALDAESQRVMRQAAKLQARTLAGLFAKAMICRASRTGAPGLARSMACDVLALRAAIWPAPLPEEER